MRYRDNIFCFRRFRIAAKLRDLKSIIYQRDSKDKKSAANLRTRKERSGPTSKTYHLLLRNIHIIHFIQYRMLIKMASELIIRRQRLSD